ncbi:MAG: glycosyltransferase [Proteobacteria bacterium]|nr:glycosyltransferase [Pseudomonadota bacterium]
MEPAIWLLAGSVVTALLCALLVLTRAHHGHFSLDTTVGVQKFHTAPTPRIGGVAVYLGLMVVLGLAPYTVRTWLMPMVVASLPAFVMGLWEDLTKRVSVRKRLFSTFLSGVLAWWLMDISLTRVNVPPVDWLLAHSLPASVLFTAFAVSGASNAFNIIDGFNGLAGGVALIALAALGLIAAQVGDQTVVYLCLAVGCVTLGFMVVNFPYGKIFLGDGGAYLIGFLIAWIAVTLPMRNANVSVWATLMACGYPILETLFSIVRKLKRRGHTPGQPDHVHLHMLVYRRVARRMFPQAQAALQNGLTSPFVWLFALLPATIATLWYESSAVLGTGFVVSGFIYWVMYLRLTQFRWCLRAATAQPVHPVGQAKQVRM